MNRRMRGLGIALVALLTAACSDLMNEPAPPFGDVTLDLTASMQLLVDEETVLPKADRLEVRLRPLAGGQEVTRSVNFNWTGSEFRLQLPVTIENDTEAWEVRLVISADGAPLYVGEDEFTLTRGETSSVAPVLDPEVASVEVTGVTNIDALGEVVSYTATARYATGDPVTGAVVTLTSSAPAVLAPEGGFAFRSVEAGTARIRAVARAGATEISDATSVLEVAVAPTPTDITLDPTQTTLPIGGSLTFSATARDRNGNVIPSALVWASDDEAVATVEGSGGTGVVTARAVGSTTVRAQYAPDGTPVTVATAAVTVISGVDRIDVSPVGPVAIDVGGSRTFTAVARSADGTAVPTPISWQALNPSVASVDPNSDGTSVSVTGLASGTTTIRASVESVTTDVVVEVGPRTLSISAVDPTTLEVGQSATATASLTLADGRESSEPVVWAVSPSNIATLSPSSNGRSLRVTGAVPGTAVVTATGGGFVRSFTVVVAAPDEVAAITFEPAADISLSVGGSATVTATPRDAQGNARDDQITWAVANPAIASIQVSSDGRSVTIVALSEGGTALTATAGGVTATKQIDVGLGGGDIQITLTWDNEADLDLWVTDPLGERVYFGNTTSQSGGRLDFDDTDGFGPENIFWDSGVAPTGTYTVQVDHYSGPSPSNWQVRVRRGEEEITFSGVVEAGQTATVIVFEYTGSTPVNDPSGTVGTLLAPEAREALPRPAKEGRR